MLLVAGLTFRGARALVSPRVGFDLLFCGGLDHLAGALGGWVLLTPLSTTGAIPLSALLRAGNHKAKLRLKLTVTTSFSRGRFPGTVQRAGEAKPVTVRI
jgi:hypothetical protein